MADNIFVADNNQIRLAKIRVPAQTLAVLAMAQAMFPLPKLAWVIGEPRAGLKFM